MNKRVRENLLGNKKMVAIVLALTMVLQCLPVATLAATGQATIVNKGDTPTPPPNLSAKILISVQGNKYVYLTWGASKDTCSGIQQYDVYRNGKLVVSTPYQKFTDYTVDENEKYIYKVVAKDYKGHTSKPSQTPVITLTNNPQKVVKDLNGNSKLVTPSVTKIKNSGGMLDGYNRIINVQTGNVTYVPIKSSALKKSTSIPVINLQKPKNNQLSILNYNKDKLAGTNATISELSNAVKSSNNWLSNNSTNLFKNNNTNLTGNISAPNLNFNSTLSSNLTKLATVALSSRLVNLLK
ncbi:MAG: hypothetical protein ACOX2X_03660 [Peptococcia bacterium]